MAKEKCKGLKETLEPAGLGFYAFVYLLAD